MVTILILLNEVRLKSSLVNLLGDSSVCSMLV